MQTRPIPPKKPDWRIDPGCHVVVVGLGLSGLAAVRFCLQIGARVSVSEAAALERIEPAMRDELQQSGVFLETGGHSQALLLSADVILASPGVPLDREPFRTAQRQHIPVLGEMALSARYLKTPAVAITGTNGKTTVTTLVGEIFRAAGKKVFVGGNIGTPLCQYLAGPQESEVAVLEVSSYQIDTGFGFRPRVAVLLNITPDHLDRYPDYQAYVRSKFGLFAWQQEGDAAVLNTDDPDTLAHPALWPRAPYFFGSGLGRRPGARIEGKQVVLQGLFEEKGAAGGKEVYTLAASRLAEQPNLQNAAAAILACRLMGCAPAAVQAALDGFEPLPHRMQRVAEVNGVTYYDDSKATNIGAVVAALEGMKQPVVLIAGGRDKGGDYRLLHREVGRIVKAMVLIGEARGLMKKSFAGLTELVEAGSMEEAVRLAASRALPGEAVLLSPACASFDMFRSYGHRGQVFQEAVRRLAGNGENNR